MLSHHPHYAQELLRPILVQFRNQNNDLCIAKSIRGHWRLQNEANILKRYQSKSSFIRPLIDEIQQPADPPSIILKQLDSELITESKNKRLTRPEIKQVAKCILEALQILHKDSLVHTGISSASLLSLYFVC